jgi:osmotically-inducible protein OsmY
MMKTDSQLQRDVMDELVWEPRVDHAHIGVAAKDGVVTLSGFVSNYAQKMAAEKAAKRVQGVRAIAEEIQVRFASDPKTSDAEIAERILDLFKWDVTIPDDKISVKVERNWVTLSGKTDWNYQKDAAKRAAGRISGVLGVTNLIDVDQQPSPANVRELIMAAVKRASDVDANSIRVTAEGHKVILSGQVHGWHERQIAERAAWAAPGVTRVEDNIVVV